MRTEPEETETNAENLEREDKIERVPEERSAVRGRDYGRSKENLQETKDRARIEFAPLYYYRRVVEESSFPVSCASRQKTWFLGRFESTLSPARRR
jgi:hypothetical protein